MDDEMDPYLGRSLKNWAASQPAPQLTRERLLQNAANVANANSLPPASNSRLGRLLDRMVSRPLVYHPHDHWYTVPLTQSRLWSFHLAIESRPIAA